MTSEGQAESEERHAERGAAAGRTGGRRVWLVCLGLAIGMLAVYAQVGGFSFVDWDDDRFFEKNPFVRGLTWENIAWAVEIHGPGQWHPLSWWVHQLSYEFFGLEPGGHHLVNVLLHMAASVALLFAFWRLTGGFWPSALVAALFAWHPLSVESVAWASHLRDSLSALFWALAMWAYVLFARRGGRRRYLLALGLFALGLMSKPTLITFPCVLLLLDYWPLRRVTGFEGALPAPGGGEHCPAQPLSRILLEKVPFFLLSAISAWLCYLCQSSVGAVRTLGAYSVGDRLANTAQSYVLHLWKIVWPVDLSHIYPYPESFSLLPVAGAVLLLVLFSAGAVWYGRRRGYLLVGWLWFLGTLAPVIGLLKLGAETSMTDHHAYMSRLGIYLVIAMALAGLVESRPGTRRGIVAGMTVLLLALLPLSWRQTGVWRDDFRLNEHALAVTKNNYMAHTNLGMALKASGRPQEAIAQYEEALRIRPEYADAHNNWGNALQVMGRPQEAVAYYEEALRIRPGYAIAGYNLGMALQALGRPEDAITQYEKALQMKPDYAEAHSDWGKALESLGRFEEAITSYQAALRINPDLAPAQFNWGNALQALGRHEEAIAHYREALRIKPGDAATHTNLGSALQVLGRFQDALTHYEEALRIKPDDAATHNNRGMALEALGRPQEAVAHYVEALKIKPDFVAAQYNWGNALLALGRPREAVPHYEEALRIQPDLAEAHGILGQLRASSRDEGIRDGERALFHARRILELGGERNPAVLGILASAYAELGNFEEAISWQKKALELSEGRMKEDFVSRLKLYQRGLPYRAAD